MARIVKVKISWSKKAPEDMAWVALRTVTAMTDNNDFENPDISIDEMYKAAHLLLNAYSNRKDGSVAKNEVINCINTLNNYLHLQAEYVSKLAKGNVTIIYSAGFESTSDKRGSGILPKAAKTPKLKSLTSGVIKAMVDKVQNATTYCFILVIEGNFNVTILNNQLQIPKGTLAIIINSTKRSAEFIGLEPLKIVHVAVLASNAKGFTALSPVATASTLI